MILKKKELRIKCNLKSCLPSNEFFQMQIVVLSPLVKSYVFSLLRFKFITNPQLVSKQNLGVIT